ncbi:MAG: hypothetical protein ABH832_02480 [bacterium]
MADIGAFGLTLVSSDKSVALDVKMCVVCNIETATERMEIRGQWQDICKECFEEEKVIKELDDEGEIGRRW